LDKKYTVFGKVTSGLEVLDQIEQEPVDDTDKPLNKIRIIDVTVTSNPVADMEN
jgi:cyclophilin family peptidyl-prolyl cis-trans isomerase